MKALVIDDSRAMRSILKGYLSDLGYQVTEAPDGKAALALISAGGTFDLAMVDWNMPEMNGLEFVTNLRTRFPADGIRLIMCTTETEMSQVAKALTAGANEYVMKPFTRDVIKDKLAMLGIAA